MKRKPVFSFFGLNSRNKIFLEQDFIEKESTIGYVINSNRAFYDDITHITIHKRIHWERLSLLIIVILVFPLGFTFRGYARIIFFAVWSGPTMYIMYSTFFKKLAIMTIHTLKRKTIILLKGRKKKRNFFIRQLLENLEKIRGKIL